ncbi:MAG: hypothetical protein IJ678_06770, partial [Kiritimatiellae bacterium]|nr:hypothetical protein [Kiritimatiellia bacterium]
MTLEEARETLSAAGQEHLLAFWDELAPGSREALLAQISSIDFSDVARLRGILAGESSGAAAAGGGATADMEPAPV